MKDINELTRETNYTMLQLLENKRKLDRCVSDPELFKLRIKKQQLIFKLKRLQEEVLREFNKTMNHE